MKERKYTNHAGPFRRVQIKFPETEGRTKQSFTEQCEINNIMARHQKTGAITHLNQHGANYGFATSHDFSESMRIVKTAQDMFNGLPSSIRSRFANDPGLFLDFVQDAENEAEMRKLGILPTEPEEQATEEPSEAKKTEPPTKATPPVAEEPKGG